MDDLINKEQPDTARRVALSMKEIARRKEFLELTQSDSDVLREVHAHVKELHVDDLFADLFYRHLQAFPELRKFIPDVETLDRLKGVQARYFKRLTEGDYGKDYVDDRLRVGYAHQRIGLEPKWYTGAYRKYLSFLLFNMCELSGEGREKFLAAYDALLKVVFFDMELALDTYFHGDRQELLHMANHDALTGLPNRNLLDDRIEQALHQAHRENGRFAILFLDLDRFKYINDSLGHHVGDHVIRTVADRVQSSLREGDTVARLGGDEFAIILLNVEHEESAALVAEKLIEGIEQRIVFEENELLVSTSMGVAIYPEDGETQEELLKNADAAMYQAKQDTVNRFRFYSPKMNQIAHTRLNMEFGLRMAMELGEFSLLYQPQINTANGRMVVAEALIRWHKNGEVHLPADFIPLAEETGLIVPIGEWVLETACKQVVAWNSESAASIRVAVNLSPNQLEKTDFVETVARVLKETGCQPGWLELEVTEGCMMRQQELAEKTLSALSDMGLTISIDDFGTGYSSLSYLKNFTIDTVKIDRSFIRDIVVNSDDATIVRAIIALAKSLNMEVVAEGVENADQLALLAELGCCNMVQGYFFAHPLPADEITRMLAHSCDGMIRDAIRQQDSGRKSPDTADELISIMNTCRAKIIGPGSVLCQAGKAGCAYVQPENFCGHPLVSQIAAA